MHWFRRAAVRGSSSAMYLLGECLLEGVGTQQNKSAALGWFAAAGDLGHRGARVRVLAEYTKEGDEGEWMRRRYVRAAVLKTSQWVDALSEGQTTDV